MKTIEIFPKEVRVHGRSECDGTTCCIHNPSNHPMNEWPIIIRLDKMALAERRCPHGIGHPDPDSVAYIHRQLREVGRNPRNYALLTHGCDGCCAGSYT